VVTLNEIAALFVFTEVAEAGSVSRAIERLGIERPTIRAKLKKFSASVNFGKPLVESGKLTSDGVELYKQIRPEMETIKASLLNIQARSNPSVKTGQFVYICQRHNVNVIEAGEGTPVICRAWRAWRYSGNYLENTAMTALRPWRLVYRKTDDGWILIEVGEKSSYATWLGEKWSKSTIGRLSREDPTGLLYDKAVTSAYEDVYQWGVPRFDHTQACIPRHGDVDFQWVSYQRLILPVKLADGDDVIAVIVVRTNQISIPTLPEYERHLMSTELLTEENLLQVTEL